ncbi:unnamed protein product [Notodromas monacha]|uniref:Integrin alpha FG-GAP repeat containing 2 n=1 Tax=Notodromas monacha TaxID=399045 RepID=A0A7R9BIL8_9CRUS|nr:unnamed protein product [Notodromas monacha]CAG0915312.1 unnamed protein product [Notodromas monacha]
MARTVSFVGRFDLKISGVVFRSAMTFGDVDNDGENELIVGTNSGFLLIYKNSLTKPWKKALELGIVAAVAVGDVFRVGRNHVVVISADGVCSIFDAHVAGVKGEHNSSSCELMRPCYVQRIQANVQEALLVDTTGNGHVELVVSLTDRVLRTYRWAPSGPEQSESSASVSGTISSSLGTDTLDVGSCGDGHEEIVEENKKEGDLEPAEDDEETVSPPVEQLDDPEDDDSSEEDDSGLMKGHLSGIYKWDLGCHLNSYTVHHDSGDSEDNYRNEPGSLLLAQPGGELLKIDLKAVGPKDATPRSSPPEEKSNEGMESDDKVVFQSVPPPVRIKNQQVSCVVLGDIRLPHPSGTGNSLNFCIATLEGSLILLHDNRERWHVSVEDELFAVSKLDMTGDGNDEIVACSWSGTTYIWNHKKECVRFVFGEPVCNFIAGKFGPEHRSCFVFSSFRNRLHVYPNIELRHFVVRTLGDMLALPAWSHIRNALATTVSNKDASVEPSDAGADTSSTKRRPSGDAPSQELYSPGCLGSHGQGATTRIGLLRQPPEFPGKLSLHAGIVRGLLYNRPQWNSAVHEKNCSRAPKLE